MAHSYQENIMSEVVIQNAVEEAFHMHAKNGTLPLDDIENILAAGRIHFSEEDLRNAIAYVRTSHDSVVEPQDSELSLAEVLEIARYLVPEDQKSIDSSGLERVQHQTFSGKSIWKELKANFWPPWKKCFRRKDAEQGFASGMKPTTRLILIVVVLTFIIALIVGGTAVALDWTAAVKTARQTLEEELDLVMNAADSFTVTQARKREQQYQLATAKMLTEVIAEVGYQTNVATVTKTQLGGARVAGMIVDYHHDISKKQELQSMAVNMAKTVDLFCSLPPTGSISIDAIVQALHQTGQLPDDHELIVASKRTKIVAHPLRFQALCASSPCVVATDVLSPLGQAFQGKTGGFLGVDYTDAPVYGGYAPLPCFEMGLVYQAKASGVRAQFLNQTVAAIDLVNANYEGSTEIMIQTIPGEPLTKLKLASDCPKSGCGKDTAGRIAVQSILNNSNGSAWAIAQDYRESVDILSTAYPMNTLNGFLLFEIDMSEMVDNMMAPLRKASSAINMQLDGSLELLLGRKMTSGNGTHSYTYLTDRRYVAQCPNGGMCLSEEAMTKAVVGCGEGVGSMIDYRGRAVLAAFECIPELDVGIVLKVDEAEIQQRSITQLIDYADAQNKKAVTSIELMVGKANASTGQELILSQPRGLSPDQASAVSHFEPLRKAAVEHSSGYMRSTDLVGSSVMAQYAYSSALGIGFALKVDVSEVEKPLVIQLVIILFTAVGIALVGVTIVGFAAQQMLASIVETWEKSKKAVQEQKESFENLVSALYPKFASDKLLAGDSQIYLELAHTTVFFSDIVGFSTISNRLTAQELMGWIGYTFGVMDRIADFFKIHKIKTIGDAYFAIAGLPGLIPENEKDDHTLRMVKFASSCVQVFSGRYLHPDAGSCLQMIAAHSQVMRKEKRDAMKRSQRASQASGSTFASDMTATTKAMGQCAMRYGIASGPVTVGVLPGKCPAFDVWGKTVNLASRMEGCGRPCLVLCSDAVYRTVLTDTSNSFTFYDQILVFAKGFGNVPAYFLRCAKEIIPKNLLMDLQLEPNVGEYVFEADGLTVNGVKTHLSSGNHSNHTFSKQASPTVSSLRHSSVAQSLSDVNTARNITVAFTSSGSILGPGAKTVPPAPGAVVSAASLSDMTNPNHTIAALDPRLQSIASIDEVNPATPITDPAALSAGAGTVQPGDQPAQVSAPGSAWQ